MNRDRTRNGKPTSPIHRLVVAEPERARPSGRALLIMSMALVAGVAAALLWVYQNPRGSLLTLPEAQATDAQATLIAASTASILETEAAEAVATDAVLPVEASMEEGSALAAGAANAGVAASAGNFSAQVAPAQQVTLAPPTPTATSTPQPPLESLEAVVAIGGADLWEGDTGLLVGEAPQGELFIATARSSDGQWLYGTTEDGAQGWASVDDLIVFNSDRLPGEEVVIIPITPTPAPAAGEGSAVAESESSSSAQEESVATATPILRPTLVAGDAPLAQVTLQDARLNLRAGPASSYPVIAKAMPDESFAIMARDATSQWLQLALPDVAGGFGWGAAEFLATAATIADLPVSDEVSDAPLYQEGQEQTGETKGDTSGETKGGQSIPGAQDRPIPPATQGVIPGGALSGGALIKSSPSVTGLTGKLAIQTTWGGDIYLYDLVTGELRLLTGGFDPAISPDGTQVAFTRLGGEHGLYVINVDGSNERKIFSERTHFLAPKWSPDGHYILFERNDELLNCTLENPEDPASACFVDMEPENATEVQQKLARVDINGENYQDIPVLPRARAGDWNSAGIVYQSPGGIQKTQDKPGAQTELVFFELFKQYELDPDWQPNGGRIIFQRRENDHWELYSVAPDGSGFTPLTFPEFTLVEKLPSNVAAAWSPDGKQIVYLSNRQPNQSAGDWAIWVMNADGSGKRRLEIDLPFTYTFVAEQMLDWGR